MTRPARYRDALAVGEFRALFFADALSLAGDQVTRVAVAALIFHETHSPLLTAAAFAAGLLPWLLGGPFLSVVADRYPRRTVMVTCDLLRAALVTCLLVPGLPVWGMLGLVFAAGLVSSPFEAARAATVPDVLPGDVYVTGSALSNLLSEAGQVAGLLAGGAAVALLAPRGAIVLDIATFLASALILSRGLRHRPAAIEAELGTGAPGTDLAGRDDGGAVAGLRLVAGDRLLRRLLALAWLGAALGVVPEALAVVESARSGGGPLTYGVLVASVPAGAAVGSLVFARLVDPDRRARLLLPLCAAGFVPLLLTPLSPGLLVTGVLWFLSGAGASYQLAANAVFVAAVPARARGRAFGIAQSGLVAGQGGAMLAAGALATVVHPRVVVGIAGVLGLTVVGALATRWPHELVAALATQEDAADPLDQAGLTR